VYSLRLPNSISRKEQFKITILVLTPLLWALFRALLVFNPIVRLSCQVLSAALVYGLSSVPAVFGLWKCAIFQSFVVHLSCHWIVSRPFCLWPSAGVAFGSGIVHSVPQAGRHSLVLTQHVHTRQKPACAKRICPASGTPVFESNLKLLREEDG
jgi:hypothetical protein